MPTTWIASFYHRAYDLGMTSDYWPTKNLLFFFLSRPSLVPVTHIGLLLNRDVAVHLYSNADTRPRIFGIDRQQQQESGKITTDDVSLQAGTPFRLAGSALLAGRRRPFFDKETTGYIYFFPCPVNFDSIWYFSWACKFLQRCYRIRWAMVWNTHQHVGNLERSNPPPRELVEHQKLAW